MIIHAIINKIIFQFIIKITNFTMSLSQFKSLFNSFSANIDKDLSSFPILDKIQKSTGIKPSHIFIAVILFISVLAVFDIFADVVTAIFGMLFPAYMSFKAIQNNNDEQKKIWLTYWIVYGFLNVIDDNMWFILQYVPGFFALRFVLYIWMFFPRANNGATIIYGHLKPILLQVKAKLQQILKELQTKKE